ncbi:Agamous-like MADS-box protein AGL82 [Camellia lanceoleosa]|uniref:Agamous-like MADS-box protein AGL82 n=1 Tax=Camellia lanceoleosa TaxID=1840588 RepID=A0ACC0I4F8_9ERIC|nr:Agamous-like MADS-box protein AGL82 [Camellia lanceoleosa]
MELIRNEKARYVTYQKRKKGLKKKTCELETLCDVQVCLIIYGPKLDDHSSEVEIWPQNPNDIQRLIDTYRNQSIEDRHRRMLDLSNFFENRSQKIEDALVKLRKKNDKALYSTWDDRYNDLPEGQLRAFEGMFEGKLADVKAKVEFMKGTQALASLNDMEQTTQQNHSNYFMQGLFGTTSLQMGIIHEKTPISSLNPLYEIHGISLHYPLGQTDHQGIVELDAKSMAISPMMMPMNIDNHYTQLGGMSSNNLQCIDPLEKSINYDPIMLLPSPESVLTGVSCTESSFSMSRMMENEYLKMASGPSQVHAWQMKEYYKANEFETKNQK